MAVRNGVTKINPLAADLAAAGSQLYPQSPPLFNTHGPHPPPREKPCSLVVGKFHRAQHLVIAAFLWPPPSRHFSETLETCATQSYSEANIGYGARFGMIAVGQDSWMLIPIEIGRFPGITLLSESTEAYQCAWQSLQSLTGTQ